MSNPQDAEGWLFEAAKVEYSTALDKQRPHVIYRPKLSIDGNHWCALYGENIQEGVCGFGKSPDEAMRAFDTAWFKEISA